MPQKTTDTNGREHSAHTKLIRLLSDVNLVSFVERVSERTHARARARASPRDQICCRSFHHHTHNACEPHTHTHSHHLNLLISFVR